MIQAIILENRMRFFVEQYIQSLFFSPINPWRDSMADLSGYYSTWSPRLLSILRIVAAFLFIQHGTQKILGFPLNPGDQWASPEFLSLRWFAGGLELFGAILLIVGLFTRPVAFLLLAHMAVA